MQGKLSGKVRGLLTHVYIELLPTRKVGEGGDIRRELVERFGQKEEANGRGGWGRRGKEDARPGGRASFLEPRRGRVARPESLAMGRNYINRLELIHTFLGDLMSAFGISLPLGF